MKATTLWRVMGKRLSLIQYALEVGNINRMMIQLGVRTVREAAAVLATMAVESIGLWATQELGSDSYLRAKPYWPYIGRGYIQCTWEYNYLSFGQWCVHHGYLKKGQERYFVNNPGKLAGRQWKSLTVAWYLSEPHPRDGWTYFLDAANAGQTKTCREMVNGGLNGYDSYMTTYNLALALGDAILPKEGTTVKVIRQEIINALRAFATGVDHGYFSHARFPILIKGKGKGYSDRINALEAQVKELRAAQK